MALKGGRFRWQPSNYNNYSPPSPEHNLIYFKLHGSLSWQKENGQIFDYHLSLPKEPDSKAVIYPLQTKDYPNEEPFKTAYNFLENCLKKSRYLIVIGYSFRDNGIQNITRNVQQLNKDLCVLAICGKNTIQSEAFHKNLPQGCRVIPYDFEPGEDADFLKKLRMEITS